MTVTVKNDKSEPAKTESLLSRKLDLGSQMTTKPPQIDMVLDGLPLGSVGVILGSGGVGKSMAVVHIAHAVATGRDDLGGCLLGPGSHKTGRVVYLAGEDSEDIIHHRVHAFAEHIPADRRDEVVSTLARNVDIVPLVGTAPSLLDASGDLNDDAVASVRGAARGARLLVIDPLRQFHAGDENNNGAVTTVIKAIAQIAHEERCTIIIVHHVSKAGAKDDPDASMSRGASAITDNARWVLAITKISETRCQNEGLPEDAWRYVAVRKVKANYVEIGAETILSRIRGGGGVLEPLAVSPLKPNAVATALAMTAPTKLPGTARWSVDDDEHEDGFPMTRGYEDRDIFGGS